MSLAFGTWWPHVAGFRDHLDDHHLRDHLAAHRGGDSDPVLKPMLTRWTGNQPVLARALTSG